MTFIRRHDRVGPANGVAAAPRPAFEWGLSFGTTVGNLSTGASLFVTTASEVDREMDIGGRPIADVAARSGPRAPVG